MREQRLGLVGQDQYRGSVQGNFSDKVLVFKIFDGLRRNASVSNEPSSTNAPLMSEPGNCRQRVYRGLRD